MRAVLVALESAALVVALAATLRALAAVREEWVGTRAWIPAPGRPESESRPLIPLQVKLKFTNPKFTAILPVAQKPHQAAGALSSLNRCN